MSVAIYMESTCDRCGAQTRQAHHVQHNYLMNSFNNVSTPEPPLPSGWTAVRFGQTPKQLCGNCSGELGEWLGPTAGVAP